MCSFKLGLSSKITLKFGFLVSVTRLIYHRCEVDLFSFVGNRKVVTLLTFRYSLCELHYSLRLFKRLYTEFD